MKNEDVVDYNKLIIALDNKEMKILNTKYKCESVRLCRFLYSLGFDKESKFDENQKEYWLFERSQDLQKSLDFFFSMRKKQKEK